MPYTFLQLKTAVQNAIGGTPDNATSSEALIVNRAKNYVCGCFPWTWRATLTGVGSVPSLDTVANQNYIILPENWGPPLLSMRAQGLWMFSSPTTIDQIQLYRAIVPASPTCGYFWCIAAAPQVSVTVASRFRMELFPTPGADQAGAFIAAYRRRCRDLTDDADVADMPDFMSDLLMQRCREQGALDQMGAVGEESEQFQRLLQAAIEEDEAAMPEIGSLNGTVDQMSSPGIPYPAVISY